MPAPKSPAPVSAPVPRSDGNPFKKVAPPPAEVAPSPTVGPGMPPGMGARLPGLPDGPQELRQPTMGKAMDGRTFVGTVGNRLLYRTTDGYVHESQSLSQ